MSYGTFTWILSKKYELLEGTKNKIMALNDELRDEFEKIPLDKRERWKNRKKAETLQKYGLVETDVSWSFSINRLLSGRKSWKEECNHYFRSQPALRWFDHTYTFWHPETQKYVMITFPYDLTMDDYQALEKFCKENGLACHINLEELLVLPRLDSPGHRWH